MFTTPSRLAELFDIVRHHDLAQWGRGFLDAVRAEGGIVQALDRSGQDAANDEPTKEGGKLDLA